MTTLGAALKFKGHITGDDDLKIAGTFEGEVAIKGELFVASTAVISGDISARSISSEGDMRGMLTAQKTIRLRSGAGMKGSLKTPQLTMEKGALLNGEVTMGPAGQPKTAKTDTLARLVGSPDDRAYKQSGQQPADARSTAVADGVGGETTPVAQTTGKAK
jgi:cytoskeletal protein CcmA (bactofilin family)